MNNDKKINQAAHLPHPSLMKRKIIHFDMDCFFAAVEIRDDPSLRGKPVIIGGKPNSRGVVATCSYEARRFGVRSAMACATAYRLCPEAIFVRPNFSKYVAVSKSIREVFYRFTDLVEPLSLDEAFLDVTDCEQFAVQIARKIKQDIFAATQLTGSAGVGPNKLIAKIASDIHKPDGLTVVLPSQAKAFMGPLPLRKIPGVGAVTERKLIAHSLHQCQDIWSVEAADLEQSLGHRMAAWLGERSRGIDERVVEVARERKSLGRETTFAIDISNREVAEHELSQLVINVTEMLQKKQLLAQTVTLKVKYSDFKQITRQKRLDQPTDVIEKFTETIRQLLGRTDVGQIPVRLLGVSVSDLRYL